MANLLIYISRKPFDSKPQMYPDIETYLEEEIIPEVKSRRRETEKMEKRGKNRRATRISRDNGE